MKKRALFIAAALVVLLPAAGFAENGFSLRLGTFMPQAQTDVNAYPNNLWAIELNQMSLSRSDYRGSLIGAQFEFSVNKYLSLCLAVETYNKNRYGYYLGYTEIAEGGYAVANGEYSGSGSYIVHTFNFQVTPITLSAKFMPFGRKGRVVPFVGGGIGLYHWGVSLRGQTIDFSNTGYTYTDPTYGDVQAYPVDESYATESGYAFGYHALGGFQIPIGYRVTIEGEARYHWAKASLGDWFEGFDKFEIGGLALTMSVAFWF